MISIDQLRKSFPISIALFFVGATLALFFVNSGVCQTAGTTADPRTYYNYSPDPAANAPSLVIQLAGVGKLGF